MEGGEDEGKKKAGSENEPMRGRKKRKTEEKKEA